MALKVRMLAPISAAGLLLLGLASTASAAPTSGPMTIVTHIDFSSFPFQGTFAVTEGASLLGCTGGTFVDHPVALAPSAIEKNLTCNAGSASGSSFVALFRPTPSPGPGLANGHWEIILGTGFYSSLGGGGDFSVVPTGQFTGMETLTGVVRFI